MGFASKPDYEQFMAQAPLFERMLVDSGISLTKFWFSVTRSEQRTRFIIRQVDPVRRWKLSRSRSTSSRCDKWDDYTEAKEAMIRRTDTEWAPWTTVKSNDKKRAGSTRCGTSCPRFDYEGKDAEVSARRTRTSSSAASTPSATTADRGTGVRRARTARPRCRWGRRRSPGGRRGPRSRRCATRLPACAGCSTALSRSSTSSWKRLQPPGSGRRPSGIGCDAPPGPEGVFSRSRRSPRLSAAKLGPGCMSTSKSKTSV